MIQIRACRRSRIAVLVGRGQAGRRVGDPACVRHFPGRFIGSLRIPNAKSSPDLTGRRPDAPDDGGYLVDEILTIKRKRVTFSTDSRWSPWGLTCRSILYRRKVDVERLEVSSEGIPDEVDVSVLAAGRIRRAAGAGEPVADHPAWAGRSAWLLVRRGRPGPLGRALMSAPTRDGRGSPSRGPRARWRARALFLIEMDPPEHGIYRRMLAGEFSVRRINHLRPRIQEVADERIDALLGGGPPAGIAVAGFAPSPSLR